MFVGVQVAIDGEGWMVGAMDKCYYCIYERDNLLDLIINYLFGMCSSRNIHTPPQRKGLEIPGGVGVKGPGISGGGRGGRLNNFLFQTDLKFHTVARKVSLFAFCFWSRERKKINKYILLI